MLRRYRKWLELCKWRKTIQPGDAVTLSTAHPVKVHSVHPSEGTALIWDADKRDYENIKLSKLYPSKPKNTLKYK